MADPDFIYDPDNWEATYEWSQRDLLEDEFDVRLGVIAEAATLTKGPPKFLALVVTSWDDDGDVADSEIRWFDTKAEAEAAVAAQKRQSP